jgi:hypothetical protein
MKPDLVTARQSRNGAAAAKGEPLPRVQSRELVHARGMGRRVEASLDSVIDTT